MQPPPHPDPRFDCSYGNDVNGKVCGTEGYGKYLWFPESTIATAAANGGYSALSGYCVASCPNGTAIDYGGKSYGAAAPTTASIPTKNNLYRCVYGGSDASLTEFITTKDAKSVHAKVSRAIEGMRRFAAPLFFTGFVAAPLLAILYIGLLSVCGGCIVWGTLFLLFCFLCLASAVSGCMAQYWDLGQALTDTTSNNDFAKFNCDPGEFKSAWIASFWVFAALTVIHVLIVCCMCGRIRMALGIIKETSHAVLSMTCSLLLFPLIPITLLVLFFAYWLYSLSYVYTSSTASWNATIIDATEDLPVQLQSPEDAINNAVWVYLFWYINSRSFTAFLWYFHKLLVVRFAVAIAVSTGFSGLSK